MIRIKQLVRQILDWELYIAAVLVAGCLVTRRVFIGAVVILIILRLLSFALDGRFFVSSPVDLGLFLLLGMIPVSILVSPLPGLSLVQGTRLLISALFFYSMLSWIQDEKRLKLVVIGAVIAGAGISLFALVSVEWQTQKLYFLPTFIYDRFAIIVRDTAHSNVMGGNIVLLLLFGPLLLLFDWKQIPPWQKLLFTVVFALMLAVLLLTQSRGALIALMASLPLIIALRWKKGWLIFPILVVGLAAALWRWPLDEILDWMSANVKVGGIQGRMEIWSRGLAMVRDFPLTGTGMGTFPDMAEILYPFESFADWRVPHVHNLILQVAIDVGIPGLVAWLAILLNIIWISWRLFRKGMRENHRWLAGFGGALLCSQVILLVHGIVDDVTWGVRPEPILWGVWGLAVSAYLLYCSPEMVKIPGE